MAWLSLSLIALNVSLLLVLLFGGRPRAWQRLRFLAVLGVQISGVLVVTLILVTLAQFATAPGLPTPHVDAVRTIWNAGRNSIVLIVVAAVWGACSGLGLAFWLTWARRRLSWLAVLAALFWVIPTFLLAVGVQEIQAQIYNLTSLSTSGGYGRVTVSQVFWAALVLGVRPAAYVFRRARVILDEGARELYVRTASAKGLSWHQVAWRHVLRPTLPIVISASLISLRLMVGSLPLVEFFFAYPGLGGLFVDNLPGNADLAIAAVAALAGVFLLVESVAAVAQQSLDPRLREVRSGMEAVT